ncbi:hypothetical protein ACCO45_006312 [Purpureocillium lilacinum]|uniref:Uncharacterized protein n=1 Tax=Purpureocillium lilacinum TaxID=33203 RepID=A0ACC4DVS2_PURLI
MGGAADTSSTVGSRVVLSATRERGARNMDRCWGSPALEVPAWLKKLRAGSGSGRASVIAGGRLPFVPPVRPSPRSRPAAGVLRAAVPPIASTALLLPPKNGWKAPQMPRAVPSCRPALAQPIRVHPASGAEPRGTEYDGSPRSGTASVRTPPLVFLLLLTAPAEQDDSVGDPRDNPRRLSTPSRGRQWTRARAAFELEYRARLCTCNVIATAAAPTTSHGVSQSLDINIILRLREDGGKEKNPDFRSQAARHSRVGPLSHLDWQPITSCEVTAETLEVRASPSVRSTPRSHLSPRLQLLSTLPSATCPANPADLEAATRLRTRTCTSPSPKDPLCRLGPGRLVAALLHPPIRRASGNEQQKSLLEPTTVCHRDSMFVKYSTSSAA